MPVFENEKQGWKLVVRDDLRARDVQAFQDALESRRSARLVAQAEDELIELSRRVQRLGKHKAEEAQTRMLETVVGLLRRQVLNPHAVNVWMWNVEAAVQAGWVVESVPGVASAEDVGDLEAAFVRWCGGQIALHYEALTRIDPS